MDTGSYYKGNFQEGMKNGHGEMLWKEQKNFYTGYWKNDLMEGFGIYTYYEQLDFNRFSNNIYIGPM